MDQIPEGMICVPICIDCGRPLFGRKNPSERCWCDSFGRWQYGLITDEDYVPTVSPSEPRE